MAAFGSFGRYRSPQPYSRYQRAYSGMGAPNIPAATPFRPSFTRYASRPGPQNAGLRGDSGSPVFGPTRTYPQVWSGGALGNGGPVFNPTDGGGGGGGLPDFSNLSFEDDPILQRVKAMNEQMISQAEASALSNKKQALIDFGSGDLVTKYLGGGEGATATAAQQNPFSTLALLLQAHNQANLGIDEGRNRQNLFYSTTRGQDLTDEQKAYLQSQAAGQSDLDKMLTGFQQQVLDARNYAAQQLLGAQESAYQRALQMALAQAQMYQYPGGGGGGPPSPDGSGANTQEQPNSQDQSAGYWDPSLGIWRKPGRRGGAF